MFGIDKEVREPIFECDFMQVLKGDSMINAGSQFLEIMEGKRCDSTRY
jgi:hypothetical protein